MNQDYDKFSQIYTISTANESQFRFLFPNKKIKIKLKFLEKNLAMQSHGCQNNKCDFGTFHMDLSHVQL